MTDTRIAGAEVATVSYEEDILALELDGTSMGKLYTEAARRYKIAGGASRLLAKGSGWEYRETGRVVFELIRGSDIQYVDRFRDLIKHVAKVYNRPSLYACMKFACMYQDQWPVESITCLHPNVTLPILSRPEKSRPYMLRIDLRKPRLLSIERVSNSDGIYANAGYLVARKE